ncbi:MAG: carbohydrate kinase family protein [Solirubrobacterales bacterium]
MRVVSLGVHILDVLGAPVSPLPEGGSRYLVDEVRVTAAGTAAGTSVDLAKLGVEVEAMGAIGADDLGDLLVARLRRHGVDTTRLSRKSVGTSATILPIDGEGERFATFHRRGASPHLVRADVDFESIASADLLHIGGPDALGDFAGAPLVEVLRHAREHGVPTTMDVLSHVDAGVLSRFVDALPFVDFFFPNQHQVAAMTGEDDPLRGARQLLSHGPGCLVVTQGAEGSLIVTKDDAIELPALEVRMVDTTGCGDAYTAGFIVGSLRGWSLRSRGAFGAACAALVGGGLGSDAGIVDLDDTLSFLARMAPGADPRSEDSFAPVRGGHPHG